MRISDGIAIYAGVVATGGLTWQVWTYRMARRVPLASLDHPLQILVGASSNRVYTAELPPQESFRYTFVNNNETGESQSEV